MNLVYVVFFTIVFISFVTGVVLTIIENKKNIEDSVHENTNVIVDEEII